MNTSHLTALITRMSNERARLNAATCPQEIALLTERRVFCWWCLTVSYDC